MKPHAILFDLDDTLWPIAPVIAEAELTLHAWLAAHAPAVAAQWSVDALRAHRAALAAQQPELLIDLGALRRASLQAVFAAAGADAAGVEGAMAHFVAARNAVTPYDDVLPGLRKLRRQVQLGTISNGNADLDVIGLAQHFSVSLAAARFGAAKPAPGIFRAACEALGVAPRDAVYVGDDLALDVAGAQAAGLRAVWMNRRGAALPAGAPAPDAICANFDELLAWLEQQLAE
ncbi:HAD family hydrolase [Pseudoduganella violaceinigra]|uniref:HAD family hydrolase n=1 Tax=Pseudoduganella violaceinigra TaxID=246602 RepID=UPI0003FEBB39|nr:HAD family hydrolase [Pseudoduganella violaceinigra]